jgi:hypothetical protein
VESDYLSSKDKVDKKKAKKGIFKGAYLTPPYKGYLRSVLLGKGSSYYYKVVDTEGAKISKRCYKC